MIICKTASDLWVTWSAMAGTFLQLNISLSDMRQDPEYEAAYQAYANHLQTCPVCSSDIRATIERVKNNPVYPVPEGI